MTYQPKLLSRYIAWVCSSHDFPPFLFCYIIANFSEVGKILNRFLGAMLSTPTLLSPLTFDWFSAKIYLSGNFAGQSFGRARFYFKYFTCFVLMWLPSSITWITTPFLLKWWYFCTLPSPSLFKSRLIAFRAVYGAVSRRGLHAALACFPYETDLPSHFRYFPLKPTHTYP